MMPSSAGFALGDAVQVRGEGFANLSGEFANDGPYRIVWILRLERQIEANKLMVFLDKLECLCARADLFGDAVQFVIEDVAQALSEDQRKDEILKLWRLLRATDAACRIPYPGFQRFAVRVRYHSPATKAGFTCHPQSEEYSWVF
jgi:hypothetical protein